MTEAAPRMTRRQAMAAALIVLSLLLASAHAQAQSVTWKTNYYRVAGTNFGEVRRSIEKLKPWKEDYHGFTDWTVKWRFNLSPADGQCYARGFFTTTTITITLPWWTTPDNADARTREQWRNFYVRLFEHEMGHARIALAAAAELNKQYGGGTNAGDCATLRHTINQAASALVEKYKQQERDYDRRTSHGTRTDGA